MKRRLTDAEVDHQTTQLRAALQQCTHYTVDAFMVSLNASATFVLDQTKDPEDAARMLEVAAKAVADGIRKGGFERRRFDA